MYAQAYPKVNTARCFWAFILRAKFELHTHDLMHGETVVEDASFVLNAHQLDVMDKRSNL